MNFFRHLKGIYIDKQKNTAGYAVVPVTLPETVYIPMQQHAGAACRPLVKPGDRVRVGQIIGDSPEFMSAPVHSSVSGQVTAIEMMPLQDGTVCEHVVIRTDGRQEDADTVVPHTVSSKADFLKAVRSSGIVCSGSQDFPMHAKFLACAADEHAIDTLIVNGAESEPYITVDHMTMLAHSGQIAEGCRIIMKWLEIPRAVIAIEENKPDAIRVMREAAAGDPAISVHQLKDIYPQGDDSILCREAAGRRVPEGKHPADAGAIVCDVSSVLKLEQYLRTGSPLTARSMTVDGNAIARPMNVEAPIGTLISDIIAFCGGEKEGKPIRKIIMGGPMTGRAVPSDDLAIVKTNNAILCLDEKYAEPDRPTACINCGRCIQSCPMDLMPVVLAKAWEHHDMEKVRANGVLSCINCGACSYVCPARRPLSAEIKQAKELVVAQIAQAARADETAVQASEADEVPAAQEGGRNDD